MLTDEREVSIVESGFTSVAQDLPKDVVPPTHATDFDIDEQIDRAREQLMALVGDLSSALDLDARKIGSIHAAIVAKDDELARVFRP